MYTRDHEWVRIDGNNATVGITDFAQSELGDIVFVEVETTGESLEGGDVFGTIEAVKTVADLFLPLSGKVLEKNPGLDDAPESVNNDPYGAGRTIKMAINPDADRSELLTAAAYRELVS